MRDQTLWEKLKGSDLALSKGGDGRFATFASTTTLRAAQIDLALTEDRRFLSLAGVAHGGMAPLRVIGDVWRFHMQGSRAYLINLCKGVIGKVIHHSPGPPAPEHDPAPQRTLAPYRSKFGREPPGLIWPSPGQMKNMAGMNQRFAAAILGVLILAWMTTSPFLMTALAIVSFLGLMHPIDSVTMKLRKRRDRHTAGCESDGGWGGGD